MKRALLRALIVLAVLAALGAGGWWWQQQRDAAAAAPKFRTAAIDEGPITQVVLATGTLQPVTIPAGGDLSYFIEYTERAAAFDSFLPAFANLLPPLIAAWDALPADDPRRAKLEQPIALLRGDCAHEPQRAAPRFEVVGAAQRGEAFERVAQCRLGSGELAGIERLEIGQLLADPDELHGNVERLVQEPQHGAIRRRVGRAACGSACWRRAGAWGAGFITMSIYSALTFFVMQARMFLRLQQFGSAQSALIEANFARTQYNFLPARFRSSR